MLRLLLVFLRQLSIRAVNRQVYPERDRMYTKSLSLERRLKWTQVEEAKDRSPPSMMLLCRDAVGMQNTNTQMALMHSRSKKGRFIKMSY